MSEVKTVACIVVDPDTVRYGGSEFRRVSTCEFVGDANYPPKCSACGWQAGIYDCSWLEDGELEYDGRFCKECGAKVVEQ